MGRYPIHKVRIYMPLGDEIQKEILNNGNPYWMSVIPRKDDIITIGKKNYIVIATRCKAFEKRNVISNYEIDNEIIVAFVGGISEFGGFILNLAKDHE